MTSKPFDMIEHLEPMCRWLYQRGSFVPSRSDIPSLGMVINDDSSMIAMGFLRSVEGEMAIWDGMVTNPERSSEDRDLALDLLMSRLLEIAKVSGIKRIFAFTDDSNTLARAIKHGFYEAPLTQKLLVLPMVGV